MFRMNKTTSLPDLRLYTFIRFSTYGENKKNPSREKSSSTCLHLTY